MGKAVNFIVRLLIKKKKMKASEIKNLERRFFFNIIKVTLPFLPVISVHKYTQLRSYCKPRCSVPYRSRVLGLTVFCCFILGHCSVFA